MNVERFRGTRIEVNDLKERLEWVMDTYGCVLVADYYDMIGRKYNYTAVDWGWLSLAEMDIATTNEIFELILPNPVRLGID